MSPLAAMPEAKTSAAESVSREADPRSSFTQQFISQPKKFRGSCGKLYLQKARADGILTV